MKVSCKLFILSNQQSETSNTLFNNDYKTETNQIHKLEKLESANIWHCVLKMNANNRKVS